MDLNRVSLFARVVEAGSFTKAAADLDLRPPGGSRRHRDWLALFFRQRAAAWLGPDSATLCVLRHTGQPGITEQALRAGARRVAPRFPGRTPDGAPLARVAEALAECGRPAYVEVTGALLRGLMHLWHDSYQ